MVSKKRQQVKHDATQVGIKDRLCMMFFGSRNEVDHDATLASIIKTLDNMAESHRMESNMMIEEYRKQTALIIEKLDSMQHPASKDEEPRP